MKRCCKIAQKAITTTMEARLPRRIATPARRRSVPRYIGFRLQRYSPCRISTADSVNGMIGVPAALNARRDHTIIATPAAKRIEPTYEAGARTTISIGVYTCSSIIATIAISAIPGGRSHLDRVVDPPLTVPGRRGVRSRLSPITALHHVDSRQSHTPPNTTLLDPAVVSGMFA